MSFQQPTSILLGVHPDPTQHQTWQSQAQSNQTCHSTHRRQINPLICRIMQLFPEPYPELRNHGSTTVQADTARLGIPIRTFTQNCTTSLPGTPDPIVPGTDIGISEIRPRIPPKLQMPTLPLQNYQEDSAQHWHKETTKTRSR